MSQTATATEPAASTELLRAPAEVKYADELAWLRDIDDSPRPFTWQLSPRMIRLFVLGSTPADKLERDIAPKFFGAPEDGRARHRHPGQRPRPAAHRRPRHGQELAGRTARRRHLRQQHARGAGNRGDHGGSHQILVERGHGHRQWAVAR